MSEHPKAEVLGHGDELRHLSLVTLLELDGGKVAQHTQSVGQSGHVSEAAKRYGSSSPSGLN